MAVLASSEIDEPVSPSSSMDHPSAAPAFFQAAFNGFTVLSANEKNTEELRLLEPGPAHEYLNALFDKLKPDLIRRCGADFVNSFEIHVTDHPWLTCHLNQDSKNIIVIDTTLLSKIKSEDALVSILGHEIGHAVYRFENNIPKHFRATIEEECFCDIFGMQMTQSLGLNPRGAEELFILLSQERQSQFTQNSNDFLRDLMMRSGDEHLTPEARVKNIQTAIGAIRLSTGDEDLGSNTSTKDLQYDNQGFLSSDQAKHVSHIDKWKAAQGYENKTLIEKLILLNSLSGEVTNEARRYEFLSLVSQVRYLDEQPRTPRELKTFMREFDKLFATLLELASNDKEIKFLDHPKSLSNFWRIDANLLGVTRELNSAIKSLNASLNQSELVDNSTKLYELIKENRYIYDCYKSSLEKVLPVYRDISDYDYDAVTEKLLKKATADKSLSLAKLLLLDTDNFRYPISINWDQFLDKFTLSQAKEIFQSNRHLINERFLEKFQYYLDLRERNESIDIDEDLFWQNPTDFLHRYKDLLISPYSRKSDSDITQSPYYGLKNEDAFEKHLKFSNNLRSIFERAIQQNDEEKIQTIVNLFVGEDDKIGLIPSILFEVSSPANYSHEAVWSDFVYQNKKIFALDQRINVLRQLHVALPENDNWLFSYLDSGGVNNLGELRILLAKTAYLDRYLDNAHGQYNKFLIKQLNRILENDIDSEDKIFDLIKFHANEYHIWAGTEESKEYRAKIRNRILNIDSSIQQLTARVDSIDEKVNFLFECDSQTLITGVDERDAILESILVDIKALDDREKVEELSLKLLRNSFCLGSPAIKNDLTNLWIEIAIEKYGIDPNFKPLFLPIGNDVFIREDLPTHEVYEESEYSWYKKTIGLEYSYKDAIIKHIQESLVGVSSGIKVEILSKLVDEIQAQPELCYEIEKIAKSEFSNQYGKKNKNYGVHIGTKGAEAFLEYASQDPQRRQDIISYLCEPLNDSNTHSFVEKVKIWDRSYNKHSSVIGHYSTDQERDLRYAMSAHDFHRNFWRLSSESRVIVMDQILAPAKDVVLDPESTLNGALSLVLERLFPTQDTTGLSEKEIKERYWARTFVELYVKSSHQTEWSLLLSCLLTASENIDSNSKVANTGKRLKAVFEALGPAYIKFGQAIHSYPNTPEDIKNELASLKNNAAPLMRWDLFRRIESAVPQSYLAQIDRYGSVLGSASFNIITEVQLNTGEKRALAVLRENSLPLATKGFNHMKQVVKKLAEQEDQFSHHQQDAINIIEQAQHMTDIETNMELGFKQSRLAKTQYDSRKITAGGKHYNFKVCTWGEFGSEWRDMEIGLGTDIKDSPAKQAILIAEMIQILSGEEFDCDRHENQYKISGNTIYVFDHGGMSLNKPTNDEKKQVGILISEIANKVIQKKSPKQAISEALKDLQTSSDYIERIKKGLLALSFTFDSITQKEGLAVVMTVFGSKYIDPLIKKTLIDNLDAASHKKIALKFANIISAGIPGYGARSAIKVPLIEDLFI